MNAESAGRQIRAWAAVGAMTPTAIFARLDQRTLNSFDEEEVTALHQNFNEICDGGDHMSKQAFTSFALFKRGISPTLTEPLHTLFDSLCYLSQVPLQTISPQPTQLTLEDLQRALMWLLPSREQSVIPATVGYRIRSPADHKRLIFQSLASPEDGSTVPVYGQASQSLAFHNDAMIADQQVYASDIDDDGDEMYQDILDVLVSTQPYIPVGCAEPSRDAYRKLAKQLHEGAPSVCELVAPRHRLESILSLILATNFMDGVLFADQDLRSVARSMAASFCIEPNPRSDKSTNPGPTSVQIEGCTWPMFQYAAIKLLPRLFDPLSNFLGTIFFDGMCPHDAHTGYFPTAEPGKVLTYPRMAQLETFLFNSICVAEIRRFRSHTKATMPTILELIQAFERLPESALLVISGRTTTSSNEFAFGVFVARPHVDGPCIRDGSTSFEDTAVLFQLSPIHDVFKGKIGKLAWTLTEDKIVFGHEGHGAALVLDTASATVKFAHEPSAALEETVYLANEHRDKFEIQFTVEQLELWAEDPC